MLEKSNYVASFFLRGSFVLFRRTLQVPLLVTIQALSRESQNTSQVSDLVFALSLIMLGRKVQRHYTRAENAIAVMSGFLRQFLSIGFSFRRGFLCRANIPAHTMRGKGILFKNYGQYVHMAYITT
jgi:hypothetical protein